VIIASPEPAVLIGVIGMSPTGTPIGEYLAPPGPNFSVRPLGKYNAQGGHLIGECHVRYARMPTGGMVIGGYIKWTRFTGAVYRSSSTTGSSGSNGNDRGWSYSDDSDPNLPPYQSGASSTGGGTAEEVMERYLNTGECTPGWDTWVNMVKVCSA
jgi:hypothetical protein